MEKLKLNGKIKDKWSCMRKIGKSKITILESNKF